VKFLATLLSFLLPVCALAQENDLGTDLQRTIEMPAHRSLQSIITDPENVLSPFATDGCSGGMSWSWRVVADLFPDFEEAQGATPPWEACCVTHDRAYHNAGGTKDAELSFDARLAADEELRLCVFSQGESQVSDLASRYEVSEERIRFAYKVIGDAMYNAVRFGGAPCSGLPWRWGFGYPGCVPGF
jgi:hypothetical protein